MAVPRFRRLYRILPRWLSSGEGELVLGSLGLILDAFVERARLGLLARFPSYAPPSALPFIGRDRKIARGIGESAEGYAARLLRWLDDHRVKGNPFALLEQLRAYCNAPVRVRVVDRRGNWFTIDRDGTRSVSLNTGNWRWDDLAASPQFSRFWVIIYPTADGEPWAEHPVNWGDPTLWGGAFGVEGYTVGTTATPEQVASVRALIREWQPDGTRCEWIIIAFDDASFDPSAPEPDSTWRYWGEYDGSGNYIPARLATARYWKGVEGAAIT